MSDRRRATATVTIVAATAAATCAAAGYYYLWKRRSQSKYYHRIVSLTPSTTQTLYDLGLADHVVGRTRTCSPHPEYYDKKTKKYKIEKVGTTKDPDWEKIHRLKPTHILFNMEENDYTELPKAQAIVGCEGTIVHTPVNLDESRETVLELGHLFGATDRAKILVDDIDNALRQLLQSNNKQKKKKFTYLYFIWHTPDQRLAGGGTYIDAMLAAAGGINVAATISQERYPLLSTIVNELSANNEPPRADYCLLSTEPFPFKEHHKENYKHFGRETKIINGEMISWHGSKMADGLRYLNDFFFFSEDAIAMQ